MIGESAGRWEGGMAHQGKVKTALVDHRDGEHTFEKRPREGEGGELGAGR